MQFLFAFFLDRTLSIPHASFVSGKEKDSQNLNKHPFSFGYKRKVVLEATPLELSVSSTIDSTKNYKNGDSLSTTLTVKGDTKVSVTFKLYRGSTLINSNKKEDFNIETTHSETRTVNYQIQNLDSGTYTLKLVATNTRGDSVEKTLQPFSVDYSTFITSYYFNQPKYAPNDKVIVRGTFQDVKSNAAIFFVVKFGENGKEAQSTQYTPNGQSQNFVIETTAPKSGLYNCSVYAIIDGHKTSPSYTEIRVSDRPTLTVTPQFEGTEFETGTTLSFNLVLSDDSEGFIHYSIDGSENKIKYSQNGHQNIPLTINLGTDYPYRREPYYLTIYAKDQYGIQSADPKYSLSFTVLSKPNLVDIQVPLRADPGQVVSLNVTFDDKDEGKNLYVFATGIGTNVFREKYGPFKSNGQKGQNKVLTVNYPAMSGRFATTFKVTSRVDFIEDTTKNSDSNTIKKDIVISNIPNLEILWPQETDFASDEKIEFDLTPTDDNNGEIKYYMNGKEEYLSDSSIPKRYTAKQKIHVTLTIPSYVTYKSENNGLARNNLTVVLIDDFGLTSQPSTLEFQIRNKIVLKSVDASPKLLRQEDESKSISFTVVYDNADYGRNIGLYIQEGTGKIHSVGTNSQSGKDLTRKGTQRIEASTHMNFPLTFWLADSENARDLKNGESNKIPVIVNITSTPSMTSNCPNPRSFGLNDSLTIPMQIDDDTNGHIKFFINSEDINQDYFYNTTSGVANINPSITFPPGDKYKYGRYNLTYYPVDEFGVDPLDKYKKTCTIEYRTKPILSEVTLSKTQADNDDIVYVRGKVTDYDVGKVLYIFQQIEGQSPIVLGNLTTVKAGATQTFNLQLENMVILTSGPKKLDIFVCDHNVTTGLDPNSFSNYSHLTLNMANNPDLIVTFPTENVYSPGEVFSIKINVTADLSGTIKVYSSYPYSWISPKYSINYNKSGIYTCDFKSPDYTTSTTIYVVADGQNNTKSKTYQFPITVRNPPKLNSVKMYATAVSPGETLTLDPSVTKDYYSDVFVFAKIGDTLFGPEKRPLSNWDWDWDYYNYYNDVDDYSISPQIPLDAKSAKDVKVVVWVQYTNDPKNPGKNSKSNEWTGTVTITKTPEVDFNFPFETQYYGYDDDFRANVVIKDDGKGTIKVTARQLISSYWSYYDDEKTYTLYTAPYSTGLSGQTSVDFRFKINKSITYQSSYYNKLYFRITVTDEYGKEARSDEHLYYLVNKPVINSFVFADKSEVLQSSYISTKLTFTDLDVNKRIYFYYSVNDGNYTSTGLGSYLTSNGKQQTQTLQLYIPNDTPVGSRKLSVYIKTSNSDGLNRNADSEPATLFATVSFKPNYTLEGLPDGSIYSNGASVPITGTLTSYGYAKLILTVGSIELQPIIMDPKSLINGKFQESFIVPDGLKYGTINVYSRLVDQYGFEAAQRYTLTFLHKNKPKIANWYLYNDVLSTYGPWSFTVVADDPDVGKKLYLYGQIGSDEPMLFTYYGITSNGKSNQFIYPYTGYDELTKLYGKQTFKIWLSDKQDSSIRTGLGVSDVVEKTVILSYEPDFDVTYPDSPYQPTGATIAAKYKMKDDGKVTLKVYIDSTEYKDLSEDIELDNTERTGTKNIKLPDDLKFGAEHFIKLIIVDQYGFSSYPNYYWFYTVNKPNLTKASFVKSFALQSEVIEFEGYFDDFDVDKYLYVFLQIGEKIILSESQKVQSNGTANQMFQFGYQIPENEPIGNKAVTIWMSTYYYYYENLDPLLSSNKVDSTLLITYKPSLSLKPFVRQTYNDGEKITIIGTITANSNVDMNFMIDSIPLNETQGIVVTESPQDFEIKVSIPVNFKYGKHKMNVWAVDASGQLTSNFALDFTIQNPPRLLSISLAKDRVKVGGKLKVIGTVRDPDVGNNISFNVSIDDETPVKAYTLLSDSTVQDFSFVFEIPQSLGVGDHELTIVAIDTDNLESSPAMVQFTVYKPSENGDGDDSEETGGNNAGSSKAKKKISTSNVGLIVGIAIVGVILVVLCVLGVILFIKGRGDSQPDSVSDHSDVEERETQISNSINLEETATRDNPLFSSDAINTNHDPFSDEFEENHQP